MSYSPPKSWWYLKKQLKRRTTPLHQMLFGNGEDGFLFESFSELDEMLTTFQGATQVASDSDAIGLAFDDHSWRTRTIAEQISQATELVTNGAFGSSVAGWGVGIGLSATANAGRAEVARSGAIDGAKAFYWDFATVAGKTYRVAYDTANSNAYPSVYDVPGGVAGGAAGTIILAAGSVTSAAGTTTVRYVKALSALTRLNLWTDDLTTVYIDNVSIKLVDGNHALQSTAGSRPVWRSNSGNPYLQLNGSSHHLLTMPPSASFSLLLKMRLTSGGNFVVPAGSNDGTSRIQLSFDANNKLGGRAGGAGSANLGFTGPARLNTAFVGGLTVGGSKVSLIEDGAVTAFETLSGALPATVALAIGGLNTNGTLSNYTPFSCYSALAVNRVLTATEIAAVTSRWGTAA